MKRLIILLMFVFLALPMVATAQEDNADVRRAAQKAAESFLDYMETQYDGEADEYSVVIDGKTFTFKIEVTLTDEFVKVMESAKAICFVEGEYHRKAIMVWFSNEDEPEWTNLVPGFVKKFQHRFKKTVFLPPTPYITNPLNGEKEDATTKDYYKWDVH